MQEYNSHLAGAGAHHVTGKRSPFVPFGDNMFRATGGAAVIDDERGAGLLQAVRAAVERARTLPEALASVASAVGKEIPAVTRVSVRVLEADGVSVVVAGVWTSAPTSIKPGVVVSALATSFPELLHGDRAVIKTISATDPALDDVLRREGVWSWVSIPLHRQGSVRGMLSISSRQLDAFAPDDAQFFDQLGSAVEDRLMSLSLGMLGESKPTTD